MAIHEQTPDQTTPTRPTLEQATEAQVYFARPEILDIARNAIRHELGDKGVRHFETILAVAKPPTDIELIPVCVRIANEALDYASDIDDEQMAQDIFDGDGTSQWARIVLAVRDRFRQWFGPVKP